jgi:hypothetical protein
MASIVIGGQTKDVGKTTLVCNIISAFSRFSWTAVKITPHGHESLTSELRNQVEGSSIWRETREGQHSDTARFLDAGAKEAFIFEASRSNLGAACKVLLKQRDQQNHLIVESTGAAEFLKPDLFLLVVSSCSEDFKESAIDQIRRADAFVWREPRHESSTSVFRVAEDKPMFEARLKGLDAGLSSLIETLLI